MKSDIIFAFFPEADDEKNFTTLIVHDQVQMDPPAQTEGTLRDALHKSVASATTFDQVGEEPVFGNQSGIAILQEIREAREWRLRKDAEVAMLKDQNAKHERAITMLTSQVTDLESPTFNGLQKAL